MDEMLVFGSGYVLLMDLACVLSKKHTGKHTESIGPFAV